MRNQDGSCQSGTAPQVGPDEGWNLRWLLAGGTDCRERRSGCRGWLRKDTLMSDVPANADFEDADDLVEDLNRALRMGSRGRRPVSQHALT